MTPSPHYLSRSQWIHLLRTGLSTGAWDFVRQAADHYLRVIPNDLEVRLLQAEALLGMQRPDQAHEIAAAVALTDPEDARAQTLRWKTLPAEASPRQRDSILGALAALGHLPGGVSAPEWGAALSSAYAALHNRDLETAQQTLFSALPGNEDIPLLAVVHLRLIHSLGDWVAALHLARTYHKRWPQTLAIQLILAHHLAESGQETQSVALLHAAALQDPGGQVIRRLFGPEHPYLALWPTKLQAPLEIPLPASVAAALGKNRLPDLPADTTTGKNLETASRQAAAAPKSAAAADTDSTQAQAAAASASSRARKKSQNRARSRKNLRQAEKALSKAARRLKIPQIAHADGRFPVYVLLSTRQGLNTRYGEETAKIIVAHMEQLAKAVAASPGWEALVLLADDPASAREHGVRPVNASDPWAIKKQLASLDKRLAEQGSMIGALLIIGGHEVVPMHHLPNPVEDDDDTVPSDNPYGALDENYLAPTWPVGRLPGSADGDASMLLDSLRRMAATHNDQHQQQSWYRRWWQWLTTRLWLTRQRTFSVGYTAAVWEEASRAVFSEIGSKRTLLVSPPLDAEMLGTLPRARMAYFNLHGLAQSPAWYGQRNVADGDDVPAYPVALRPEDIPLRGKAPKVVFSEACYGAHIDEKTPQSALCLRFLYAGTQAFVGSTVTAYGAVTTPLAGADLLGHLFWQRLKAGLPAGEALRQAKYLYAQTIHQRNGFLDADDHKTLISFVLYGDPLHRPLAPAKAQQAKGILRPKQSPDVRAVQERIAEDDQTLPPHVSKQIKALVETCLPGSEGVEMLLAQETLEPAKGKTTSKRLQRKVVIVSQATQTGAVKHRHFMRVIMDNHGKVVKVTLSR